MPYAFSPVLTAITLLLTGCASCPTPKPIVDEPIEQLSTTNIENLDWLVGTWRGSGLGGHFEEVFLKRHDNTIPAAFRRWPLDSADEDDMRFYEFILLEENTVNDLPANITYSLHHFNPGMSRWEDEPVVFELTALQRNSQHHRAVFTAIRHTDTTTQLVYHRIDKDMSVYLIERTPETKDEYKMRLYLTRVE